MNCSICKKGIRNSRKTGKCRGCAIRGRKFSEEHKRKLSEANKGKHEHGGIANPNYRPEIHIPIFCKKCDQKITRRAKTKLCGLHARAQANTGIKFTEERKQKIRLKALGRAGWSAGKKRPEMAKENNPNWKGGITPTNTTIRCSMEYEQWRKNVFERDNYICQMCEQWGGTLNANHIKKFADHPELRLEITNGITLCKRCHNFIHNRERCYEWLFQGIVNYQPLILK